ncbi:unnamed protein product, partial [marine sediment metagenome]
EKKYADGYIVDSTYITVRDGVKIAATICLPKGLSLERQNRIKN